MKQGTAKTLGVAVLGAAFAAAAAGSASAATPAGDALKSLPVGEVTKTLPAGAPHTLPAAAPQTLPVGQDTLGRATSALPVAKGLTGTPAAPVAGNKAVKSAKDTKVGLLGGLPLGATPLTGLGNGQLGIG
ncbi:ATP-binding protein [Streptomyces sp. NPDC047108]|uniref:ATP-binding protein n=1 Tax=Streptomyces sp. NPDC047108 TaxID=3155025 RepID=UPI00340C7D16